jgi:hypothetical protein
MLMRDPRSIEEKVALFRKRFSGLQHVYGTYDRQSGRSWQVKSPVTDEVILNHLHGRQPYGVYLLVGDRTRAAVVDFDSHDANPPIEFCAACQTYGMYAYIESSRSKGYHVWLFGASIGVLAVKVRSVIRHILDEIQIKNVEVFPKQDRIDLRLNQYGNFVNTPFGGRVHEGRTVFLDPDKGLRPFPNQWKLLDDVHAVCDHDLDEIIELNDIKLPSSKPDTNEISLGVFLAGYSLPPCAQRMLAEGVTRYQRLSCFRLAVHLKRVGLPFELVLAAMDVWSQKNHPEAGKSIITPDEVWRQVDAAFKAPYKGYGCEKPEVMPFCAGPVCHIFPVVDAQRRRRV